MDRDWTASFSIRFRNGTCIIILDKKYNIANSSCHFGSYGSIWAGPSPKKYYMDLRSFGPYNIFLVTDRSIYCHMTLSAMNYLLCISYLCPNSCATVNARASPVSSLMLQLLCGWHIPDIIDNPKVLQGSFIREHISFLKINIILINQLQSVRVTIQIRGSQIGYSYITRW